METLELRNLFATYTKTNKAKRFEMYYNEHTNNLIVFEPCDPSCDTESICNGISNEAYKYLINILNTTKDIIVWWSQVDGTTSDYNIYYDFDPKLLKNKPVKELFKILSNSTTAESNSMKYNIIKGNKLIPITREEMKMII